MKAIKSIASILVAALFINVVSAGVPAAGTPTKGGKKVTLAVDTKAST
jgi:hypothetical protein